MWTHLVPKETEMSPVLGRRDPKLPSWRPAGGAGTETTPDPPGRVPPARQGQATALPRGALLAGSVGTWPPALAPPHRLPTRPGCPPSQNLQVSKSPCELSSPRALQAHRSHVPFRPITTAMTEPCRRRPEEVPCTGLGVCGRRRHLCREGRDGSSTGVTAHPHPALCLAWCRSWEGG